MKKITYYFLGFFLIIFFNAKLNYAQGYGGIPGEITRWGVGVRALGMGRAYTALANDATAPYWNPAGLVSMSSWHLSLMTTQLFYDTWYHYCAIAGPTSNKFALGLNLIMLHVGGIEKSGYGNNNELLFPVSDDNNWQQLAMLASFGYRILEWPELQIGGTIKAIRDNLLGDISSAFGLDLGLRYRFSWLQQFLGDTPVFIGLHLQNIQNMTKIRKKIIYLDSWNFDRYDKIPFSFRLGICFIKDIWKFNTKLIYELAGVEGQKWYIQKAGIELPLTDILSFRSGFNFQPYDGENKWELTFGMGINWDMKLTKQMNLEKIDIAFGSHSNYKDKDRKFRGGMQLSFTDAKFDKKYQKALQNLQANESKRLLREIIEYEPLNEYSILALARWGDLLYENKQYELALKNYRKAIDKAEKKNRNENLLAGVMYEQFRLGYEPNINYKHISYFNYFDCLVNQSIEKSNDKFLSELKNAIDFKDREEEKKLFNDKNLLTSARFKFYQPILHYFEAKYCSDEQDSTYKKNKWKIAETSLKEFIKDKEISDNDPEKIIAQFHLASSLKNSINFIKAKAILDSILFCYNKLHPDKSCYQDIAEILGYKDHCLSDEIYYCLGECYYESGKISNAIQEFRKLLLFYPFSDKSSDARNMISKIIKQYPDTIKSIFYSADSLNKLNEESLRGKILDYRIVDQLQGEWEFPIKMIKEKDENFYILKRKKPHIIKYNLFDKRTEPIINDKLRSLEYPISLLIFNDKLFLTDCEPSIRFGKSRLNIYDLVKNELLSLIMKTPIDEICRPTDIALIDTLLFITNFSRNQILKFSAFNGEFIKDTAFVKCKVNYPFSIAIDTVNSEFYIGNWADGKVLKFDKYGKKIDEFKHNFKEDLIWAPVDIDIEYSGKNTTFVYVVYDHEPKINGLGNRIIKYSKNGKQLQIVNDKLLSFSLCIDSFTKESSIWVIERKKNYNKISKLKGYLR